MFNAQRRLHHREAARLMQYIPAACSTSEWPAGGVNPKPPKTSLQAVVDAESRPSIPRWGKRSPRPPVAVAAFVPPTPAATSGSLSSLISCPCGTLLAAVPRITWHFYFAFCPAIFLPLTELRIGPPRVLPPHPITLTPSSIPPDASRVSRRWSPFNSRSSPTPRSVRCFPIRMAQTSPVIGGF